MERAREGFESIVRKLQSERERERLRASEMKVVVVVLWGVVRGVV